MKYTTDIVSSGVLKVFFDIDKIKNIELYGQGHINKTLKVTLDNDTRFILQGVNKNIFENPEKIIHNILRLKDAAGKDSIILPPIKGKHNEYYYDDIEFSWRLFPFADGYNTYQKADSKKVMEIIGRGYSKFVTVYKNVNPSELHVILPDFHNIEKRYNDLQIAFDNTNSSDRKEKAKELMASINQCYPKLQQLHQNILSSSIPLRVTHNDTKINNILIAEDFSDFKVIDLDTIMPGSMLYDFGDMCRSACNSGAEDSAHELETSFSIEVFDWICSGYCDCRHELTISEIQNLITSIEYMGVMLSMRFLTDYLDGDKYFKVQHSQGNYIRARNQLLLVSDLQDKAEELKKIIQKYFK